MSETLGSLLAPDRSAAAQILKESGADQAFAGLAREVVERLLPYVRPELVERIRAVLDVPVSDILAGAWGRSLELLQYRDPERYPPEKVSIVPLAEHTVDSRHQPVVEVEVSGVAPAPITLRLKLDVRLKAKVKGVKIVIQGGKIRKLLAGTVDAEGTLFVREHEITSARRAFALPGEIVLRDGIAIAPAIALGEGVGVAGVPASTEAAAPPPANGG
jgi:hypothetical protein